ncbi:hypothetical protein [Halobacterium jilantaiense]|uniref:Uncharacterized protein n=1 Tax=Halobacterium jilantaiense TaxID=355548 RepID=A0A1I0PIK3_9EURY|nr:hypothetical protein [Halobacterium jilantaiense]SEW14067.1 hypothetical protein SAMN04487945_1708 [Halobacterium jilantaiense]
MTDEPDDEDEPNRDDDHLATVDPGAGCTEIWEHLSEYRTETDEE